MFVVGVVVLVDLVGRKVCRSVEEEVSRSRREDGWSREMVGVERCWFAGAAGLRVTACGTV